MLSDMLTGVTGFASDHPVLVTFVTLTLLAVIALNVKVRRDTRWFDDALRKK